MSKSQEKKYYIKAPIVNTPLVFFWNSNGRGYTTDINAAHQYRESEAKKLKEKEPLLELIPA